MKRFLVEVGCWVLAMVGVAVVAQVRQAWVPTLTGYLLLAVIGGVLGAGAQLPRLTREATERNQGRHR